jgi:hypothetical protein
MSNWVSEIIDNNDGTLTAVITEEDGTVVSRVTYGTEDAGAFTVGEITPPGVFQRAWNWLTGGA